MFYENILKNGKIIYPENNVNIVCDRCFRSNLTACITFEEKDLCLYCVEKLSQNNINPNNDILVRMEANIYNIDNYNKNIIIDNNIILINNIKTFKLDPKCIVYNKCIHEVFINNKKLLIDGLTIQRKYWNFLKPDEKEHFINSLN
jgi:hypothetical protein